MFGIAGLEFSFTQVTFGENSRLASEYIFSSGTKELENRHNSRMVPICCSGKLIRNFSDAGEDI